MSSTGGVISKVRCVKVQRSSLDCSELHCVLTAVLAAAAAAAAGCVAHVQRSTRCWIVARPSAALLRRC
jgi:hypothetical protein